MTFSTIASVRRTQAGPKTSTQAARQGGSHNQGVSVLPAVDVNLGTVTFLTPRGHHAYYSPEPDLLVSALEQAVRPARWVPEIATLVVTVAQTGVRAGRGIGFRLAAY